MVALSCVRRGTLLVGSEGGGFRRRRSYGTALYNANFRLLLTTPRFAEHPRDFVQDLRHCAERVTKAAQSVLPRDQTA